MWKKRNLHVSHFCEASTAEVRAHDDVIDEISHTPEPTDVVFDISRKICRLRAPWEFHYSNFCSSRREEAVHFLAKRSVFVFTWAAPQYSLARARFREDFASVKGEFVNKWYHQIDVNLNYTDGWYSCLLPVPVVRRFSIGWTSRVPSVDSWARRLRRAVPDMKIVLTLATVKFRKKIKYEDRMLRPSTSIRNTY